jgi:hypothetical protein
VRTRLLATGLLTAAVAAGVVIGLPASAAPAPSAVTQTIPEPANDPFYQPPDGFENTAPGTVLRSRQVTVTGLGIPIPVKAWQTLARSNDAKGGPVAVASTLMVPSTPYLFGKRPLLSYQTAIDSLGDQCNPSFTLRTGTEKEIPLLASGLLNNWAVVVTDYQGPRNAYGAGPMEGHGVLDGIRAVERLPGTGLAGAGTPVGLWGYSGGGLATSSAAELLRGYAPELAVKGIASGGTPADLAAAGRQIDGGPFSGLFLGAAVGISREYPETLSILSDAGRALVRQIGDMCVEQLSATFPFRRFNEFTTVADPLSDPRVADTLRIIELGKVAPPAPVYLYHSIFDELIPFAGAQKLRDTWCEGGTKVTFHADPLSEHVVLAASGAPAAVAFLAGQFNGVPVPSNCG